ENMKVVDERVVFEVNIETQAAGAAQAAAQRAVEAAGEAISKAADASQAANSAETAASLAQEALQEFESGSYPKLQEIPNQFEILDEEGFLIFAIRANGEI